MNAMFKRRTWSFIFIVYIVSSCSNNNGSGNIYVLDYVTKEPINEAILYIVEYSKPVNSASEKMIKTKRVDDKGNNVISLNKKSVYADLYVFANGYQPQVLYNWKGKDIKLPLLKHFDIDSYFETKTHIEVSTNCDDNKNQGFDFKTRVVAPRIESDIWIEKIGEEIFLASGIKTKIGPSKPHQYMYSFIFDESQLGIDSINLGEYKEIFVQTYPDMKKYVIHVESLYQNNIDKCMRNGAVLIFSEVAAENNFIHQNLRTKELINKLKSGL